MTARVTRRPAAARLRDAVRPSRSSTPVGLPGAAPATPATEVHA
ncbi:hypothetical protein QFZ82_003550 [Streptomyces sp. V4I23]|nr:hypothetical protein [Streptomyces sp. V4I23]